MEGCHLLIVSNRQEERKVAKKGRHCRTNKKVQRKAYIAVCGRKERKTRRKEGMVDYRYRDLEIERSTYILV